ncbi:MAG: universal stress protein [Desulfobacterales bacterium]
MDENIVESRQMVYNNIMVAINPVRDGALSVFGHALKLSQIENAHLMILTCMHPHTQAEIEDRIGTVSELDSSAHFDSLQHKEELERSHHRAWLEGLAKQAAQVNVSAITLVDVGNPNHLIPKLARRWKADLIVMGLTQRGPFIDRLLGSVTSDVVRHAPCSVLLVHP